MTDLEITIQDEAGAGAALQGGSTRVELCTALRLGGLTPSQGMVEAVLERAEGQPNLVHVIVRSRGSGYVYVADEIAAMTREIKHLKTGGVQGVVVGALDACTGPALAPRRDWNWQGPDFRASVRSIDGLEVLEPMVREGPDGIEVMAGGGVRLQDIAARAAVGVDAVHLSARVPFVDRNQAGPGGGAQEADATSSALVGRAREVLDSASSHR